MNAELNFILFLQKKWTALHFAAEEGKSSICEYLISSGADSSIRDRVSRADCGDNNLLIDWSD